MEHKALENEALESVNCILDLSLKSSEPLVIAMAPPGAGKTWLIENLVAAAVVLKLNVCCVTPRAAQGYDLLRRIINNFSLPRVEAVIASHRTLPDDLDGKVCVVKKAKDIGEGAGVCITTAQKLSFSLDSLNTNQFDLLIVDEAYQLPYKDYLTIAHLALKTVMVGDPGQLDPIIKINSTRYEHSGHKVHWALPKALLNTNKSIPVVKLPATRRLTQDTTDFIQPSFYPDLPFQSLANSSTRTITFDVSGIGSKLDQVLDLIQQGASIVSLVLPGNGPEGSELDHELAEVMAKLSLRFIQRGAKFYDGKMLQESDIGLIDPRTDSVGYLSNLLRSQNQVETEVNTPEQWQGLQRPVTIVRNPLSGSMDGSEFNFDKGRYCVALSRHLCATIIVTRAGVKSLLTDYSHDCASSPSGANDDLWDGYSAHSIIWEKLESSGRVVNL